ncbi:MAG: RnfABCDGE type electron transport complex subunit B [Deltaproteobacteria bacterium]|nr:MAG: RnfABCDGE type electron transport complex subunit B [Deltaproteobacteria bacterium]
MSQIAIAVSILTGLGLFFGGALAVAHHFLHVEEDPRLDATEALLPGNNCGACGEPGCRAFAEKLVARELKPGKCTVSSPAALERIAALLGVEIGAEERSIARLKCGGEDGSVERLATYQGITSCRAAVIVDRGGRACPWGCLGLGDCVRACTFDALTMGARGLPEVDPERCSACGDCVEVCPLELFVLVPEGQHAFVQCSSPLVGAEATARCAAACDACGLCVKASRGALEMAGGLPVAVEGRTVPREAVWKCPTGALVWLETPRRTPAEPPAQHLAGGPHG